MIRAVDQSKCIGCGTCQRICPLDVFRLEISQPSVSPCMAACPIHNNIREIHYLLQMGKVSEAARVMRENNPLASVTGRICPLFCESECTRNQVDAAVNISAIEQYLGDYVLEEVERAPRRHVAPVAVVGSGPAGLSCAFFLAADGFLVTVFEAKEEPGGMLRYGIPEYRVPSTVLSSFIARLRKMGVVIKCGQVLDETFALQCLQAQGFGAIFLGPGVGKVKKVQIEGIDADGVFFGMEFLEGVRTGRISKIKPRVAVVGGGDVAMVTAQSALRLGAQSVTIIALEGESSLPAYPHNVETAKAEGIDFLCSHGIEKIFCVSGRVAAIELMKCLSVFDEQGAFAPKYDHTQSSKILADTVIFAIGQEADLSFLPEEIVGPDGLISVDPKTCQTSMPNVFAAGDAVTGSASVAEAVGGGKRAANAIMLYLRGMELEWLPSRDMPVTEALPENSELQQSMRHEKVAADQTGTKGFSELYKGFDLIETLAEADRCMVCGAKSIAAHPDDCMTCFACEINCPGEAIFVHPFKEILPRTLRSVKS